MFLHRLTTSKDVDLDELYSDLENNGDIVNFMLKNLGDMEYYFVVDCVKKRIDFLKEQQQQAEEEQPNFPPIYDEDDPCDPCKKVLEYLDK